MMGMEMLIKSLGIDPKELKEQVAVILENVEAYRVEQARQGAMLDAIARKLEIGADEIRPVQPVQPLEIEHNG